MVHGKEHQPKGGRKKKGIVSSKDLVGYLRYTRREDSRELFGDNLKVEGGYFEYTSRDSASIKTFTNYGWLTTEQDINDFKIELVNSFNKDGNIAWLPVQAYKDYMTAAQYGLFHAEDYAAITGKVLNKFFKYVNLDPNNMLWWMDYHNNEKHPHVHLVFLEKEQTRTRGKFTQKELNYFRGALFQEMKLREMIITDTYQLNLDVINENSGDKKMLREVIYEMISSRKDDEIKKMLINLRRVLPSKGRLQYGASHMIPYRSEIDKVIDTILTHPNIKADYEALINKWQFLDSEKSRELKTTYTAVFDAEDGKLRKNVANEILRSMKDIEKTNDKNIIHSFDEESEKQVETDDGQEDGQEYSHKKSDQQYNSKLNPLDESKKPSETEYIKSYANRQVKQALDKIEAEIEHEVEQAQYDYYDGKDFYI